MIKESTLRIGTWPTPERAVRITVPATVANDLGRLQKALGSIAERLGHPKCMSGVDCTFLHERDFVINPAASAIESVGGIIIVEG